MIIVSIHGGLGNQLFQYAFGQNLAKIHQTNVYYDLSSFDQNNLRSYSLHHFGITLKTVTEKEIPFNFRSKFHKKKRIAKILNRLCYRKKIVFERKFNFNASHLLNSKKTYYWGYWQSEKYFIHVKENLMKSISPKINELNQEERQLLDSIESTNSVCIHVRRGDYVNHKIHPLCDKHYYDEAINHINNNTENPFLFVFSDDIDWCVKNLKLPLQHEFVHTTTDWKDFTLMTYCKHYIIANSTFSWWAAYLGKHEDKIVISPAKWFNVEELNVQDLKPSHWINF